MKIEPIRPQLLLLGVVIGLNFEETFGARFEIVAYILLGICTLWLVVDAYNKGPAHG